MPIQVPSLDDRSYQDLVDEVLARIPAHTPEWTNPMPGDPGRTMVELFAWLTDTLLYRVNLVPERQRLAFLRLLGVPLQPARAARTVVSVSFANLSAPLVQALPPLTRVKGPVPFETRTDLTVLPIAAETYCKRPLTDDELDEMRGKIAELSRLYPIDQKTGPAVPYLTTPVFSGGAAAPGGFDLLKDTVDHAIWYALLTPTEDGSKPENNIAEILKVLSPGTTGSPQYLNLGIAPKLDLPAFAEDAGEPTPIPFVCELTTPNPSHPRGFDYLPLTVVLDTTKGLTTDGILRLALPSKESFYAPTNNVRDNTDAGSGDRPPRLDDLLKSARLIAWIRLRPTVDVPAFSLSWTGINAVEVDQRLTTTGLVVGQGTGQPDQQVQLPGGGIEESTFRLKVEEAGRGYLEWKRIADLALAGIQEAVFQIDAESGGLRFGDGIRGKIPARGARIRVECMRLGGGSGGNLSAGSITQVLPSGAPGLTLRAAQPLPAAGGMDAETLAEAEKRIPALFRNRDRAVTAGDYESLAATTPGVRVGRVEVLPLFKPQERRSNVPGVVSVMVLPYRASYEPPYPRVDRVFLSTIFNRLGERKPLGTELYVIGCEYVQFALTVGIDNPGGKEETNTAVKEALKKHLFSLAPGGPQGRGWPLGRTVKRRELEVVISRVEGVDGVYGPNLFTKGADGNWKQVAAAGGSDNTEITLLPWQLPELIGVIVAPGVAPLEFTTPAPTKAKDGLAIPVVPEVC